MKVQIGFAVFIIFNFIYLYGFGQITVAKVFSDNGSAGLKLPFKVIEMVVYSDKVPEPVAVRYTWADNPECNLVNLSGLPAISFRTDDWKGITQK